MTRWLYGTPKCRRLLYEFEINVMLNSRLRLDVAHTAQDVCSSRTVSEYNGFARDQRRGQSYDCTLRQNDYGPGLFVYCGQIFAYGLRRARGMNRDRNFSA